MKNVIEREIKIEGQEWQNCLDKSFKKKSKEVKIDGFRIGAAPKEIFIKKYYGFKFSPNKNLKFNRIDLNNLTEWRILEVFIKKNSR